MRDRGIGTRAAVMILRVWLALFAAANFWRGLAFLLIWRTLPELQTAFNPVYLGSCALIWSGAFVGLSIAVNRLQTRIARVTILSMLAYLVHQWANFVLLSGNSEAQAALGARALVSALAGVITVLLALRQRACAEKHLGRIAPTQHHLKNT